MSLQFRLLFALGLAAGIAVIPAAANAQAWAYYMNDEHRFSGLFPGEPREASVEYTTAAGTAITAHEFLAERGEGRYSITVVDFAGHEGEMDTALAHEAASVRALGQPGYDEFAQLNGIPGHAISVITPEGRQVLSQFYLYETRLYIARGNEPPGAAPAAHFTQSLDIHHPDGSSVNLNPGGATTREEIIAERERAAGSGEN
jgi:hypothetical protein